MTNYKELLRRAAEMLRSFVNTYGPGSEEETGSYCSDEDAEMDGVALSLLALASQMENKVLVPKEPTGAIIRAASWSSPAAGWTDQQVKNFYQIVIIAATQASHND